MLLKEIGEVFNISESRASRVLTRAELRLRQFLEAKLGEEEKSWCRLSQRSPSAPENIWDEIDWAMNNSNALLSKEKLSIESSSTIAIGPGAGASVHNEQDKVSLNVVREKGQVKFIEVQCECGKITRIVCDYE